MGGPRTRITQEEVGEINAYSKLKWSTRKISEAVKRDIRTVRKVLRGIVPSTTRSTCNKVLARRAKVRKLVVAKKIVDGVEVGRLYPSVRSIQAAYKRLRGAPEAHHVTIHRDIIALSRVRPKVVNA